MGAKQLINPTSASNTWKYSSFNFTATGTTTTPEFRNTQVAGMQYSFLDSVSVAVTPVPEPETYALMLAGLGPVSWATRRRS